MLMIRNYSCPMTDKEKTTVITPSTTGSVKTPASIGALARLPGDALLEVIKFLTVPDLCLFFSSCKELVALNGDDTVWEMFIKSRAVEKDWADADEKQKGFWRLLARYRCIHHFITLGNQYNQAVSQLPMKTQNTHEWAMFVGEEKTSKKNMAIRQVTYYLHPTFTPTVIACDFPPFVLRRVGWGTFAIRCQISFHPQYRKEPINMSHTLVFGSGTVSNRFMLDFHSSRVRLYRMHPATTATKT